MLSIDCPRYGWARMKIDDNVFLVSYTTDFGYDFLCAAYLNYLDFDTLHSFDAAPRVILFDTESDGEYYVIFCGKQLTICSTDCPWAKHYYFESAKDLLDQVMNSMYPFAQEWLTFYEDKEDTYMLDLFKEIKEEVYGQTV